MTFSLRKYKRYWPLAILILLGLYNAYGNAFMQDDAYISYNYAKWFSRGYGLVWYPGSTEFGYTNFLYTLMIGIAMLVCIPPEIASNIINVISFIGCLVLVYKIGERLLVPPPTGGRLGGGQACSVENNFVPSKPALTPALPLWGREIALLPVLFLATHHTFTAYATGGLETMWVTLLILGFYWHILTAGERSEESQHMRLGTIAALALLSRLDTALLLFPGYVYVVIPALVAVSGAFKLPDPAIRRGLYIPLITTLGFLLCCYMAYGYALPNTFYIKIPGSESMLKYGLRYLWLYNMLQFYVPLFLPLLILYFFARRDSLQRLGGYTLLLAAVLLLWLTYIANVGGDFMEFRFLVPVLAFYYLVVIRLVQALVRQRYTFIMIGVICAFLLGNALHPILFRTKVGVMDFNDIPKKFDYVYVESTDTLNDWITVPKVNWSIIGKSLGKLFSSAGSHQVILAIGPAGVISFYSEMHTFDLLGLNSRSVINDHNFLLPRAGHTMIATDRLLQKEKVVLNVFTPQSVCKLRDRYVWVNNPVRTYNFTRQQTLFVPLNNECYVVVDYLIPHPKVDELIEKNVILRYRDVAKKTDCPDWLCLR